MTAQLSPYTPGSGRNAAVDNVDLGAGAGDVAYAKIVDGTTGGTDVVPASATKGLAVEPRPTVTRVRTSAVVSTTPAYSTGDAIGGELTFANVVRTAGQTGTLLRVQLTDKGQQAAALELHLFSQALSGSSAFADNAALNVVAADLAYFLGAVTIAAADWKLYSATAVADIAVELPIKPVATTLYGYLVIRGAETFVSTSDLAVTVLVRQD